MARTGNRMLASLLIAAVAGVALRQLLSKQQAAFVPPQNLRGESAAALAAAILTVSALGVSPAAADVPPVSFFGVGGGKSDAYNQIDADAISPYSQFSNPKDSIYKKGTDLYVQKKKTALQESFKRLEKIPELIKTKQAENIKSALTSQTWMMRANMEYLSGERNSKEFKKVREFFQDIADLGVAAYEKRWPLATESYDKAAQALGEWKTMVSF